MVTKQQQLAWLAKNWCVWVHSLGFVFMSKRVVGDFVSMVNYAHQIGFDEWQQERDKMQKKQEEKLMSENEFEDELEKMYWDFDAERAKKAKCERLNFKMFMRIASGLRVERKQENSWHERGELPPAGGECEVLYRGEWVPVIVIGIDSSGYCVFEVPECMNDEPPYDGIREQANFRPLRTEREKAIDEMAAALINRGSAMSQVILGELYDAGFRMEKPQ